MAELIGWCLRVRNVLLSPIVNWKARWVGENDQASALARGGFGEFTDERGGENCYIDEFVLMVSQAVHAWWERRDIAISRRRLLMLDVMVPQQ